MKHEYSSLSLAEKRVPSSFVPSDLRGSERPRGVRAKVGFTFIALVLGSAIISWTTIWCPMYKGGRTGSPIEWKPCKEDETMYCGYLEVPTDYDDPSVGITRLAITKILAKVPSSRRKGTLLTNYGGPGGPGYAASFDSGKNTFHPYALSYDLISWDPRGIGRTMPNVNCHGSAAASAISLAGTIHEETFDVPPDPFSEAGTRHLVAQQREAAGIMQVQAELCGKKVGADVLKYMGTTTLIRDMERISAVLEGKDAKINLISGSYGTIVAAYLVNMLPHKVGRVLTWGVADPPLWANHHYEDYRLLSGLLTDAENAYDWFLKDCHNATSQQCALSRASDNSYRDIKDRIDHFLNELYHEPMVVSTAQRPGLLKSGMVRAAFFNHLQRIVNWPSIAGMLDEAMRGNGTALRNYAARVIPEPYPEPDAGGYVSIGQGDLARLAVSCADAPPYEEGEAWPTAEGVVEALQGILRDVSPNFGATVNMMEQHGGCQFWPRSDHPVDRFTGPWNSTLSNVILVASNNYDPITPKRFGHDMAKLLGPSARHIIQDAPGHCFSATPVPAFLKAVTAYFENGTVPDNAETFYPADGKNRFMYHP